MDASAAEGGSSRSDEGKQQHSSSCSSGAERSIFLGKSCGVHAGLVGAAGVRAESMTTASSVPHGLSHGSHRRGERQRFVQLSSLSDEGAAQMY